MEDRVIKNLRASGSNLQADVVIGTNSYGSDVTVSLRVKRTEPGVQEALVQLDAALLAVANALVETSVNEKVVQQKVREQLAEQVGPARIRAEANAGNRVRELGSKLEKTLTRYRTAEGTLGPTGVMILGDLLKEAQTEAAKTA
jgi:hypothetical protein